MSDNPLQKPLDIKKLDELLNDFARVYPEFKIWIEPGRFLWQKLASSL